MRRLPQRSIECADGLPKAAPPCPGAWLHPGRRAAVDPALSRLARSGKPMRFGSVQKLPQGEVGEPRHHANAGRRLPDPEAGGVAARCGQAGAAPVDPAGMNADHREGSGMSVGFLDTGGNVLCCDVGPASIPCLSAQDGSRRTSGACWLTACGPISRER